ncbi:MAG: hypothetical protein RIC55_36595 [Pirellulaceae bacterium]
MHDTTLDAQEVQLRLLREKSPSERARLALRLTSDVVRAARRSIGRTYPEFSERQVGLTFIELHYGREIARALRDAGGGEVMDGESEIVSAMRPVVEKFVRLGVRHYVGGSIASSIHGAARSTLDVDVAAELDEINALHLIDELQADYYVSRPAVLEAVRKRKCFNLIHQATSFKVDVFVSQDREFDRSVQSRAAIQQIGETNPMSARVATAEDVILLKLEWYRLAGETSQRQWSDVSLVARLQGERLDREYLCRWAGDLGVADLLERLLADVERDRI